ncbi:MAG: UDP-N-acetylglucosamine 2-epimerase (non-hydrolyzing) [Erythrobacter sp.]
MASELPKILVSFGTRPEAIKMFPVVAALKESGRFQTRVAVTAQHREMLDQVLDLAKITPDHDLDLMQHEQSLDGLAGRILTQFGKVLDTELPDRVLVHGDTLTTSMVAQACYFRKIPVGHVEAGLRSGDNYSPWPEEVNRKIVSTIADLHFAPTNAAADALRTENISRASIYVTGNSVIDALLSTRRKLEDEPALAQQVSTLKATHFGKRVIAVTAHRRENFGTPMRNIAEALLELSQRDDLAIIYPVHPNPAIGEVMRATLAGQPNISLIEPLDYPDFVALMELSHIVLTDSGGVQEESPSLGKPVLVMRDTTERPEGVAAGTARLIGTDQDAIVREVSALLDDEAHYQSMAKAHNPYGDGNTASRIAAIIAENC